MGKISSTYELTSVMWNLCHSIHVFIFPFISIHIFLFSILKDSLRPVCLLLSANDTYLFQEYNNASTTFYTIQIYRVCCYIWRITSIFRNKWKKNNIWWIFSTYHIAALSICSMLLSRSVLFAPFFSPFEYYIAKL